ncbi:MAG TPA: ribulose-phosphate 3-epimerase [Bacteroidales bacterium]|nr:ribulose-phosphate 3-epimerase [Bacteroidales bacterium]
MAHLVSPSLLAADFGRLDKDIDLVNKSEADWLHLDIMDGVFVPNISFGFPVLKYVKELSGLPLDVHLMIVDPDRYLERFRDAGASILTVHYEACRHLNRTVNEIRRLGMKAGVSLNPHTPVSVLEYVIPYIDLILIMTVNPGYGGQQFISNSYDRIRKTKELVDSSKNDVLIQVDGGVDTTNAAKLLNAGVDVLVAGSSVFGSKDPTKTISQLKKSG